MDCFVEISARLFHGLPKVLVQRADLSGNSVGFHRSLYHSTTGMAKYEKSFDTEDGNTMFETGDNLRRHNIAGHPRDTSRIASAIVGIP